VSVVRTPAPVVVAFEEHWSLVDECERVVHAVECAPVLHLARLLAEGNGNPHEPLDAVCGRSKLPPWWRVEPPRADLVPWPPRVASLTTLGYRRCSDCWNLTGRRPPHKDWPS